ncbi:MAG TPA: DUF1659 domain-containing protein [Pseudogracilibacillus sp.]|nr:DUF1659 domain-containing protein [Pseudogracilibacillus sp.]
MVGADLRSSQLRLVLAVGIDPASGRSIQKTKTFSNIKTNSTDEAVFNVAQALLSVQTSTLANIARNDVKHLYLN